LIPRYALIAVGRALKTLVPLIALVAPHPLMALRAPRALIALHAGRPREHIPHGLDQVVDVSLMRVVLVPFRWQCHGLLLLAGALFVYVSRPVDPLRPVVQGTKLAIPRLVSRLIVPVGVTPADAHIERMIPGL
jgi:hypothetical protein